MRVFSVIFLVCMLLLAGGCATAPRPRPLNAQALWQDQAFDLSPALVTETPASLFALDPAIVASFKAADRKSSTTQQRLQALLNKLYSGQGMTLTYSTGATTGAQQTWDERRGDCLSLTILVYTLAQGLGIDATMQEVRVPFALDRRGGIDFISGHVNVRVQEPGMVTIHGRQFDSAYLIIDFEPQLGSSRSGEALTQEQVLARFYNNRGAQFLLQRDVNRAYAYYRAALEYDPGYAGAHANMAQLYARQGLPAAAERLLRHSLALNGTGYAALRELVQLLEDQGRSSEAQVFARELATRRNQDPYYWLGVGMDALGNGRNARAVDALERATKLTTGFGEVHYHLALAYLRTGQIPLAQRQLALLRDIKGDDPEVAVLQRKLAGSHAKLTGTPS